MEKITREDSNPQLKDLVNLLPFFRIHDEFYLNEIKATEDMLKNLVNINILLIFGYSTLVISNVDKFVNLSNLDTSLILILVLFPNAFWITSIFVVTYTLLSPIKFPVPWIGSSKFLSIDLDVYLKFVPEISSNYFQSVFSIKNSICLYSYIGMFSGIILSIILLIINMITGTTIELALIFIIGECLLVLFYFIKSMKKINKIHRDYEKAFGDLEDTLNSFKSNLVQKQSI